MSNTLFNDAALNVKVALSSGGIQENELAAQNTITIQTSGGAGTTSNLKAVSYTHLTLPTKRIV